MQKTAYEMRSSDWSSDVCSADLGEPPGQRNEDRARETAEQRHAHDRARRATAEPPRQRGKSRVVESHRLRRAEAGPGRVEDRLRAARGPYEQHRGAEDAAARHDAPAMAAVDRMSDREIGRAHVCTPVPNAQLACRL